MLSYIALLGLFLFFDIGFLKAQSNRPGKFWPPEGKIVRCKINRDTWGIKRYRERTGSNGGAKKFKLKGHQEIALFDIDPLSLRGKIITGALLHFRSAMPQKAPFIRLGVSTIASEWTEGTSRFYIPQRGSACYLQASHQRKDWAYPGSTLMDVVFGKGHTVWRFAECSLPDQLGWQSCAVSPDVISARVAGISHGFCLFDEVGNTWSLKDNKFTYTYFPNRFCYSSEDRNNAPWMEIWVKDGDLVAPGKVELIHVDTDGLPGGEAIVRWRTPNDAGGSKTIGFYVTYRDGGQEKKYPDI